MKHTLSFDWRGKRQSFVIRLPSGVARFTGRHLWRLGVRRWQLEAGSFPSSYISTKWEPVTRLADQWNVTPPRHIEINGVRALLIEGERTNLALWSDGKPQ